MPKSPEEMAAAMFANLKDKTGKTMPQWLKITKASKLAEPCKAGRGNLAKMAAMSPAAHQCSVSAL